MKSFKMLMMAALTILTISVFSQNIISKSPEEQVTNSKKESMKMDVMKIQTFLKDFTTTRAYSKKGLVSNLYPKDQMKSIVMNLNNVTPYYDVANDKSGKCSECLTVSNLTPKEQLKMKVIDLYTCQMSSGAASDESGKCAICGMDLTTVKTK